MRTILLFWACIFAFTHASALQPVVKSKAGIYRGRYLPEFEQDLFLGVKYAPKPVRFTPAQLAKDTPLLIKQGWTTLGEDCLHLNIVVPRTEEKKLPVLLWIYGGGWQQGATSDPR
jgi:acetylcholinesterase